jgi:hypothetical protein
MQVLALLDEDHNENLAICTARIQHLHSCAIIVMVYLYHHVIANIVLAPAQKP